MPKYHKEELEDLVFANGGIRMSEKDAKMYTEKICNAMEYAENEIKKLLTDKDLNYNVWQYISHLTYVYKEVYFQVGMRVGAKIGYQLYKDMNNI